MAVASIDATLDPVLAAHRVSAHRFELSGLRTGSVRDQMLRAHLLVSRMLAAGVINPGGRLLVAGGGAAGVTAALAAVRSGVDVTLLEREDGPFRTQMAAMQRRLDPFEYDWPQPHWSSGDRPWADGLLPLPYARGQADQLGLLWEDVLMDWIEEQARLPRAGLGELDLVWGIDAFAMSIEERAPDRGTGVVVHDRANPTDERHFDAALSCIGFSGEKVRVDTGTGGQYRGYEFWGHDPFDSPTLGLRQDGTSPLPVLVSGGGDGAQQDIQRLLTGDFGRPLLERLQPHLPALELQAALLAEDAARRQFAWRQDGQHLRDSLKSWNDGFLHAVDRVWDAWDTATRDAVAGALLRPHVRLTWLLGGDGPDFCYGLNRLLTLLLLRLHAHAQHRPLEATADREAADEVMVYGRWLRAVRPAPEDGGGAPPHRCGSPKRCLGQPHLAELGRTPHSLPGERRQPLGPFVLVVVRHGIDHRPLFRKAPLREQIVPFDLLA